MNEAEALKSALQRLIDEHLEAVERALATGGVSRAERRRIADDLELQIREMLTARAGADPTESDLRAVLAELDPPEAYRAAGGEARGESAAFHATPAETEPRMSKVAIWGALWGSAFPLIVLMAAAANGESTSLGDVMMFLLRAVIVMAPLGATILGCVAISQIRHSGGKLLGLKLAVSDALFYPLLALDVAIFKFWAFGLRFMVALIRSVGASRDTLETFAQLAHGWVRFGWWIFLALTLLTAILVNRAIVQRVWRVVKRPVEARMELRAERPSKYPNPTR